MNVIDVRGLVKRFGSKTVVDHVTMTVAEGEIVGFLGPNGSGKTTTIRIMCGLLTPDEGEGTVLGFDIRTDSLRIKREVGYMTQKFSFYEDLTIGENLEFVARLYRLKPVEAVDAADELEVLADGEVLVETEALSHVAGLALDGVAFAHQVVAEAGAATAVGGQ